MARLYSYIRFSTPEQATGSSLVRQSEYAERYAAEHGLELDHSLSLRDEGLSAYHQRHIKQGALGTFLRAVDDGLVPEGSILIIETLDRLSRAEPLIAQGLLSQIINAGIAVVTANDGKRYDRESLKKNPMDLVYTLLLMIRAHEESDTKSKRVSSAIRIQCEDWVSGKKRGHIRNGKPPFWLRETGNESPPLFEFIPERVEALRLAIQMYVDGHGVTDIARKFNAEGLSYTGKPVSKTYLHKIIKRRDLVGIKALSVAGEDYELEDYYPAVLSDVEWSRLQARISSQAPGASGDIVGVITGQGVCFCGYCGAAMSGVAYLSRARADGSLADGHRRLLCGGASQGLPCPVGSSSSIVPAERAILEYCSDQMSIAELMADGARFDALRAKLAKLDVELSKAQAQIDKITEMLLLTDRPPLALMRKQRELEESLPALNRERDNLAGQIRADGESVSSDLLAEWRALSVKALDLDKDSRVKVRALVARTFERIDVYIRGFAASKSGLAGRLGAQLEAQISQPWEGKSNEKHGPIDLALRFKSGAVRLLRIDRYTGEWVKQEDY